eukprot:COSAG02_NODE_44151_length_368_cov_1.249071_1_plen_34_part_10
MEADNDELDQQVAVGAKSIIGKRFKLPGEDNATV